jgi:hypothetical protein
VAEREPRHLRSAPRRPGQLLAQLPAPGGAGDALTLPTRTSPSDEAARPHAHADLAFAAILTSVYAALSVVKVLHHELWRDEAGAWLIGAGSTSLRDVYDAARYGGHPYLWIYCLYLLNHFTDDPLAMQLFHVLIATSGIAILSAGAPFERREKVLIAFGYYLFYEYDTISRNYAFGVVFAFAACAAFAARPRSYLWLAVWLALLAQSSVYGAIMAIALALGGGLEALHDRRVGASGAVSPVIACAAAGIVLIGLAASVVQMTPPPDSGFAVGWLPNPTLEGLGATIARVWTAFVPWPSATRHFWQSNVLEDFPRLETALGACLLVASTLLWARWPSALLTYVAGTIGLLTFMYVKYAAGIRHDGHIFILFLVAWWMSRVSHQRAPSLPLAHRWMAIADRHRAAFVTTALWVQLGAGVIVSGMDLVLPFSASAAAAQYIRDAGLIDLPIVCDRETPGASLAAYLHRSLYYPMSRRWGTFTIWNNSRHGLTPGQLLDAVRAVRAQDDKDVLLVLTYPLTAVPGVRPLRLFEDSSVESEVYYLYRVSRD